jgi:hypothetical protein
MSYATHKALDDLHEHLAPLIDRFIESYIGHFGKQPVKPFKVRIDIASMNDTMKLPKWLQSQRDALTTMITTDYKDTPGFQNVLEEMISLFDNTLYLIALK